MPFPFLEAAGAATQILSGFAQQREARKRFRAMQRAAKILGQRQDANFATAGNALNSARAAWEADPARLSVRQMYEERLKNPTVIDDAMLSTLKAQGMNAASRGSEGAITALREQAQRSGLGGSAMASGAEATLRSRAFGRNQAISNQADIEATTKNRAYADDLRREYSDYNERESSTRFGYAQAFANLLASRQYGESDLLAAMG